jgi:flagellar hook-associated protein 3 FlgL
MRVNPNLVPDILAGIEQSQKTLNIALQQVSTGKSVTMPSDNPAAAAEMVRNTIEAGSVDQYTQNISTVLTNVQSADSALSSVVSSLTSAISLGTQGANGTMNPSDLQIVVSQVQSILQSVISQANTAVGGVYLFGGTASGAPPYTADSNSPASYTYNGNYDTNSVEVGDNLTVQTNLPGSQIFSSASNNVIGSLTSLISALQSGSSSSIGTAVNGVSSALSYVSQQRVFYGNAESQLNSQQTQLQQETLTLSSQATSLVGVNMAEAATELSQAETANSAALAAAAKVLPNSLLNYLSNPS